MAKRTRTVLTAYTIITILIIAMAMIYLMETSDSSRSGGFTDKAAPFCIVAIFFLVPLAAIVLFLLNRKVRKQYSTGQRIYLGVARLAMAVSWVITLAPMMFLIAIAEPWPLTMLHGPDTKHAKDGFESYMGVEPPSSVSKIYFRAYGMLDCTAQLRFTCSDKAFINRLIKKKHLKPDLSSKPRFSKGDPRWWVELGNRQNVESYSTRAPAFPERLWFDLDTNTAWFELRGG